MGFFGNKAAAAVEEAEPALRPEPKAEASRGGSRKLWGVLLVLSIVLVFIFGGAVAGLVYMRMSTPPLAQVPRPAKGRKAPPPAAPEATATEAPKAEASKPEEPKTEPKAPEATTAVETTPSDRPTGSPAVHAASLPKRSAEPIAAAAKTAAPATPPVAAKPTTPPAGGKVRAVAVEFAHSAPSAKEVLLRGPFLVRTGGKQAMLKDAAGVWKLSLSLLPGNYKYSFIVDGKRTPNETRQVP